MVTIDTLLEQYEKFCNAVKNVAGLEVEISAPKTSTEAEIAALEGALKVHVPDDLRTFWKTGFRNLSISEGSNVLAAAQFISAKGALQQVKTAHDVAGGKYPPQEPEMVRWLKFGIPLHEEENYCLVDAAEEGRGRVHQIRFDGAPLTTPIASSFTRFFELWLASGCFSYGNADADVFKAYWSKVAVLVPIKIEPAKNDWLKHVGRFYENTDFP
jgi:hypothetical protein